MKNRETELKQESKQWDIKIYKVNGVVVDVRTGMSVEDFTGAFRWLKNIMK